MRKQSSRFLKGKKPIIEQASATQSGRVGPTVQNKQAVQAGGSAQTRKYAGQSVHSFVFGLINRAQRAIAPTAMGAVGSMEYEAEKMMNKLVSQANAYLQTPQAKKLQSLTIADVTEKLVTNPMSTINKIGDAVGGAIGKIPGGAWKPTQPAEEPKGIYATIRAFLKKWGKKLLPAIVFKVLGTIYTAIEKALKAAWNWIVSLFKRMFGGNNTTPTKQPKTKQQQQTTTQQTQTASTSSQSNRTSVKQPVGEQPVYIEQSAGSTLTASQKQARELLKKCGVALGITAICALILRYIIKQGKQGQAYVLEMGRTINYKTNYIAEQQTGFFGSIVSGIGKVLIWPFKSVFNGIPNSLDAVMYGNDPLAIVMGILTLVGTSFFCYYLWNLIGVLRGSNKKA